MKTYIFRSILTEHVERVIPNTVFSRMELDFKESTSAQHKIELSLKDILTDRAWRSGLFISILLCLGVFGLTYGLMLIVMKKTLAGDSGSMITTLYVSASITVCLILWLILTLKIGLSNKKRDVVEKERGKGNWRIVDEKDWDKFIRLLNA
ncbi:MAG TPA: hypothetical protein PK514_07835, partial [Spirochaetota bacterium]|nr:hypothetical protein [Spirochaetota bacterium]